MQAGVNIMAAVCHSCATPSSVAILQKRRIWMETIDRWSCLEASSKIRCFNVEHCVSGLLNWTHRSHILQRETTAFPTWNILSHTPESIEGVLDQLLYKLEKKYRSLFHSWNLETDDGMKMQWMCSCVIQTEKEYSLHLMTPTGLLCFITRHMPWVEACSHQDQ